MLAHMFWHGELTSLERASVKSFVNNGFDVYLWSLDGTLIEGTTAKDAREILDPSVCEGVTQYFPGDPERETKVNQFATIYSDCIRHGSMAKYGGWWFDCDCICLKPVSEFIKLTQDKSIVATITSIQRDDIMSGMFWLKNLEDSQYLFDKIVQDITEEKRFVWGLSMLNMTNFVNEKNYQTDILPTYSFVAIEFDEQELFINPVNLNLASSFIKDSFVTHIFNSRLKDFNIDKNNPPEGSLLYKLMNECPFINNASTNESVIKRSVEHRLNWMHSKGYQ